MQKAVCICQSTWVHASVTEKIVRWRCWKKTGLKLNLISRNLCLVNLSGMVLLHVLGTDIYSMPELVFCSTAITLEGFLFAKSRRIVFRDITTPCQYTQNSWQSIQNSSASVLYCNKSNQNLFPVFHCCRQVTFLSSMSFMGPGSCTYLWQVNSGIKNFA